MAYQNNNGNYDNKNRRKVKKDLLQGCMYCALLTHSRYSIRNCESDKGRQRNHYPWQKGYSK